MLNNELYKLVSSIPESNIFKLKLLSESKIYAAHFPGQPITPGVCIIQIASELLQQLLDCTLTLTEVVNAKFLVVIDPIATPEINFCFKKVVTTDDHKVKATVEVTIDNTIFTKLSLLFTVK